MGRCLTEDVWTIRTFSMTDGFIQNISLSLKRYGYLTLSWKRKSAFTVQDRSAKGSCHHYHLLLILLACVIAAYLGNEAFEKKDKALLNTSCCQLFLRFMTQEQPQHNGWMQLPGIIATENQQWSSLRFGASHGIPKSPTFWQVNHPSSFSWYNPSQIKTSPPPKPHAIKSQVRHKIPKLPSMPEWNDMPPFHTSLESLGRCLMIWSIDMNSI